MPKVIEGLQKLLTASNHPSLRRNTDLKEVVQKFKSHVADFNKVRDDFNQSLSSVNLLFSLSEKHSEFILHEEQGYFTFSTIMYGAYIDSEDRPDYNDLIENLRSENPDEEYSKFGFAAYASESLLQLSYYQDLLEDTLSRHGSSLKLDWMLPPVKERFGREGINSMEDFKGLLLKSFGIRDKSRESEFEGMSIRDADIDIFYPDSESIERTALSKTSADKVSSPALKGLLEKNDNAIVPALKAYINSIDSTKEGVAAISKFIDILESAYAKVGEDEVFFDENNLTLKTKRFSPVLFDNSTAESYGSFINQLGKVNLMQVPEGERADVQKMFNTLTKRLCNDYKKGLEYFLVPSEENKFASLSLPIEKLDGLVTYGVSIEAEKVENSDVVKYKIKIDESSLKANGFEGVEDYISELNSRISQVTFISPAADGKMQIRDSRPSTIAEAKALFGYDENDLVHENGDFFYKGAEYKAEFTTNDEFIIETNFAPLVKAFDKFISMSASVKDPLVEGVKSLLEKVKDNNFRPGAGKNDDGTPKVQTPHLKIDEKPQNGFVKVQITNLAKNLKDELLPITKNLEGSFEYGVTGFSNKKITLKIPEKSIEKFKQAIAEFEQENDISLSAQNSKA